MTEEIKCKGGCGRLMVDEWDGYRSFSNDRVMEWVCDSCWARGVRTDLHARIEKERGEGKGAL